MVGYIFFASWFQNRWSTHSLPGKNVTPQYTRSAIRARPANQFATCTAVTRLAKAIRRKDIPDSVDKCFDSSFNQIQEVKSGKYIQ